MVRKFFMCLALGALLTGCTGPTLEKRRQERAAAYASFPAETKASVDQGRIQVGMTPDAVYIAWGPPAQVLEQETQHGAATTWIYEGGWMEETRYWSQRRLLSDYQPRTYVRAEVVFVNGHVSEWRTLPQPQ